jgi:cytochrome c553
VYLRVAGRDVEEATSEIITDSRDEWQKLKVNFRVKAKSGVLLFALFGGWTDATGTVWYDDMELIQLSSEKVVKKEKPIESLLAEQAFGKSSEELIQIFSLLNTKLEEKAQVYMQGLENIQNLQFNSEQINRLRKLAEDAAPKNQLAIATFASNNGLDLGLSRYHNQIQGFEAVILEGEISNGKKLSKSCIVCHGEDFSGYESERAPSLAQFSDWYLQSQLQKFKHGIRGGDVNDSDGYAMKVLMQNYSFQQIADLSAYISSLEPKNMVTTLVGDAKKGADLYKNCVSCHQADGLGNKDLQAPKLAGLSDFYILKQLNNFKGGIRGNGNGDKYGKLMQIYANLLKDEQSMKDLAVYLTGLKPQISSSK